MFCICVLILFCSLHSLCIRYSSDDTDDDTNTNVVKKKKSANLRRQTLANPMPPPSIIPPDAASVTKNPVKENLSPPYSEFKDPNVNFDNSGVPSATRMTSKTTQSKFIKTQRTYVSDGLETGSDSDVVEEAAGSSYGRSYDKYLSSNPGSRLYDSRMYDRGTLDYDPLLKTRPAYAIKDTKYNVSPTKPSISSIQPAKEDVSGRDSANQRDLLANYETPFLSEFTRRLSSRSLINTSASPLPNLKSKRVSRCNNI